MEKLVTNMDQHGRVLIPSEIREMLNIRPGDKVNLEVWVFSNIGTKTPAFMKLDTRLYS